MYMGLTVTSASPSLLPYIDLHCHAPTSPNKLSNVKFHLRAHPSQNPKSVPLIFEEYNTDARLPTNPNHDDIPVLKTEKLMNDSPKIKCNRVSIGIMQCNLWRRAICSLLWPDRDAVC